MPWPDDAPGSRWERKWERRSAASCGQIRSDAVIVALLNAVTCSNVVKQRFCWPVRSVRDEEAAVQIRPPRPSKTSPLAILQKIASGHRPATPNASRAGA
jgi:hypothetical protein